MVQGAPSPEKGMLCRARCAGHAVTGTLRRARCAEHAAQGGHAAQGTRPRYLSRKAQHKNPEKGIDPQIPAKGEYLVNIV
jgi:hypothetical protein